MSWPDSWSWCHVVMVELLRRTGNESVTEVVLVGVLSVGPMLTKSG